MLQLLLLRLWPALIPLAIYVVWHWRRSHIHTKEGKQPPKFFDGPWLQACIAAILLAACSLLLVGVLEPRRDNVAYEPARLENGKIIKGHFNDQ